MKANITMTFALLIGISAIVHAQTATVAYNQQSNTLQTREVVISTDSNNRIYRFVGNSRYEILNPSEETLLYRLESPSAQGVVMTYYFSRGAGEVQELTLANVKKAFAGNTEFHEALDAEFRNDAELANYQSLPTLAAIFPVSEVSGENSGVGF